MKNTIFIIYLIIIIYIYILYQNRILYNKFLTGFWKADDEYCKNAEIDNMILYLDYPKNNGYLIINKDENLIENTSFSFTKKILNNYNNLIPFNNTIEYCIKFNSDDDDFTWNNGEFKLKVSIIDGALIILKDNIIFSILHKDNNISNKFIEYENIDKILL